MNPSRPIPRSSRALADVEYWFRLGAVGAEASPPRRYAHAYALGRRTARLQAKAVEQPDHQGTTRAPLLTLERMVDLLTGCVASLLQDHRRLRRRAHELERLALTDPLTGLPNRRAIDRDAEHEVHRRCRQPGPLAFGIVDADHFKRINGKHLLTGGDEVLKGLARVLSGTLRSADRMGRIGGEEFAVLAPHTDQAGAAVLAERIRAAVEQTPIHYRGATIDLTVSVGFVVAEAGILAGCDDLRHGAAAALAEAKHGGRNRIVVRALEAPAPVAAP
jgi:diguanylate cyclase (GGDEF)-like protein